MIKKLLLAACVGVALAVTGQIMHTERVFAAPDNPTCTGAGALGIPICHGYFTGADGTGAANNLLQLVNVLPAPAYQNVNAANFVTTVQGYLNSGNYQTSIGAALTVDAMLNQQGGFKNRGGAAGGVAYAKANFGTWAALINHFIAGGAGYGINWSLTLSSAQYCGTPGRPTINTAFYIPVNDDIVHNTVCYLGLPPPGDSGNPVIDFYWPGGSFFIGRPCGNVEVSVGTIPQDKPPVGSINVVCNGIQQVATITLSDPDGATNGYITTGAWPNPTPPALTYPSPGPHTITIPPPPTTSPYVSQPVDLWVKDVGLVGTQKYQIVAIAPTKVPCVTLTCGNLNVTPALLDPNMQFSATATISNNVNLSPPGATITLKVNGPGYSYQKTQLATGGGSVSSATFNPIGPTNSAGVFAATWTMSIAGSPTCTASIDVVHLPYLSVYGGDVQVGSSPTYTSGASVCASNPNAGAFSWNNHTTNFSGAGAQYAVQALAQIEDFASALTNNNTPPVGLSLSDELGAAQQNSSQGLFGGYFGTGSADCDFTSDITSSPITSTVTVDAANYPSLFPSVPIGTVNIIYVKDADVYINGNVMYASSAGWANIGQIPYFRLVVVGGSIYIDDAVTQLDGLYVAESDSVRGGGTIYTCARAAGVPENLAAPGVYTRCGAQLVVNGAFVANQVQFERTHDSLGQARPGDSIGSNHAAEVFNYTPELWLPHGTGNLGNGYTAITSLPPIL